MIHFALLLVLVFMEIQRKIFTSLTVWKICRKTDGILMFLSLIRIQTFFKLWTLALFDYTRTYQSLLGLAEVSEAFFQKFLVIFFRTSSLRERKESKKIIFCFMFFFFITNFYSFEQKTEYLWCFMLSGAEVVNLWIIYQNEVKTVNRQWVIVYNWFGIRSIHK